MQREIFDIIYKIHGIFRNMSLTLSVAESCTGGLISHYLTNFPGASKFFHSGVVAYSIEAKKSILGISSETISKHGVISMETVSEMAEKVRQLTESDYSIAATGNLGPDILENKERGLVYIAVSRKGEIFTKEIRLTGDRGENKEAAANSALSFLVEVMDA